MNGWSISGSMKANHHWQSGNKLNSYFWINPFKMSGGYNTKFTPSFYRGVTRSTHMRARYDGEYQYEEIGLQAPATVAPGAGFLSTNYLSMVSPRISVNTTSTGYGKITVRAVHKPDIISDITFYTTFLSGIYYNGTNNYSNITDAVNAGVIEYKTSQTESITSPTWSSISPSDGFKGDITISDLCSIDENGATLYIKFTDPTISQFLTLRWIDLWTNSWQVNKFDGATPTGAYINIFTDDQETILSNSNYKIIVIPKMITQKEYDEI